MFIYTLCREKISSSLILILLYLPHQKILSVCIIIYYNYYRIHYTVTSIIIITIIIIIITIIIVIIITVIFIIITIISSISIISIITIIIPNSIKSSTSISGSMGNALAN